MSITTDQILSETIQIKSSDIFKTRNIDGIISHKLKKYEGKCTKNGYIVKDSIEIVNRSVGKIINIDNKSLIEYKINYKIKTISPNQGCIYDCIINNITKMGLICFVEFGDQKELKTSPLLIIVPKEYCDIEKVREGSKIKVETMDKRVKYLGTQIQLIGKITN
jgi:hypothetical protein